ncbi:MAG: 50S ribosomal protein L18 [Candidatus Zixiibacteriota bacterium]
MADRNKVKLMMSERRRRRVRSKVRGTTDRPRLSVCKSLKNVTVQIIDDVRHVTLVGLSSNSKTIKELLQEKDTKTVIAKKTGMKAAELAKAKGIQAVVFDRNRYRYHGRVKAVAEGAREAGLKF